MTPAEPSSGLLRALGWGAYLACSWTWCIGMFLPILLLRDFGPWGFVVFAVPNVLGAAAMGWVLRQRGASEAMVATHGAAMVWFTSATLGFHVFWGAWLAGSAGQWIVAPPWAVPAGAGLGIAAGAAASALAWGRPVRWATLAGPLVLCLSLVVLAGLLASDSVRVASGSGTQAPDEILWLAPVTIFGFALCPYLDLTFHRARQALTPPAARLAFGAGFGVLFAAMIALTVMYSGWLVSPVSGGGAVAPLPIALTLLTAHLAAQATFTILAHAAARRALSPSRAGRWPLAAWTLVIGPIAAILALQAPDAQIWGLSLGEAAYRSFLGLYGLVFPAYVWLLVIPTPDGHAGPRGPLGRRKLIVWGLAVAAALPFFIAGFLARESLLLAPGLAFPLLARLAVRKLTGGTGAAPRPE